VSDALVAQVAVALLLDRLLGDPRRLPHPVRWIGSAVLHLEPVCVGWLGRTRLAGVVFALAITGGATALTAGSIALAQRLSPAAGTALSVYFLYTAMAARELDREASSVARALGAGRIECARRRLARIVGRDTVALDEREVVRGAVETVAESTVDGCVSPLFYALLGGPAAALAFKAVNTLDSMVGHRTPRYLELGWASARLDDVLGFVPARLVRWLAPLAAALTRLDARGAWRIARRDGAKSPSPNAGIPEAALAGALGVQLGGVNFYDGIPEPRPRLGDAGRPLRVEDVRSGVRWMYATTALCFAVLAALRIGSSWLRA
jgi:adenosylcobinamide-phosphate synthase